MMNSRDKILQSVRNHKPAPVDLPSDLTVDQHRMDIEDRFVFHLDAIGGKTRFFESRSTAVESLPKSDDGLSMNDLVRDLNTVEEGEEPGITVVEAKLAVAENGAVYVTDEEVVNRESLFLGHKIIALVPRESLLVDMHEAYDKIDLSRVGFGIFIAGPSATADIAQILVRGAHGPSEMEVWFF